MEPIIREARPEDRPFIEEIARLTWDGEDYLARVFDEWLGDNFYVLELDGKVVGTAKLTILPGKVGWLEGLRVHPEYRGRGYGRKLHDFMLQLGEKLAKEGRIEALEFATYFLSRESIAMAKRDGFSITAKFFNLGAKVSAFEPEEPAMVEPSLEDLTLGVIPAGLKFLRRSHESLEWLKAKAEFYDINGFRFLVPKGEATFTPLDVGLATLKAMLPAMAWVARERGWEEFEVMLPSGVKPLLPGLRRLGLFLWEETEEPNVLVFRKRLVWG
ncbi:GNAT family N-acetyltransferase [Thermococcus gammatolerans]|uniref:Acetyltransferase, GNAT family n=1 Tax=Thermococcus gammatolerans (strain DSM 15229 / JCM 11827 / EJ3) TaxID=593117 RepID=C5A769_THEGJ|nr:GNAT family N-acetyltransferase [Thermococcus gammatolerans]ACS34081.1 Acetyltransferase, GNAT family [Thermococcus gammatolerans EJ3]